MMLLPTMSGSELNTRFQIRSLKIATAGFPGLSSSGNKRRPRRAFAPSISSKLDCVRIPSTNSACSRPVSVKERLCAERDLFERMVLVLNVNELARRRPVAENPNCR